MPYERSRKIEERFQETISLIKRKEWGRIMVLVVSFFNLINFPLGTALGIYSIIILMKEETAKLFSR